MFLSGDLGMKLEQSLLLMEKILAEIKRANSIKRWSLKVVSVQRGVSEDSERLEAALSDDWEPFSVTRNQGSLEYHFRREV